MNAPLKTNTYSQNRVDILAELSTKLNKFRRISEGRYIACCPVHGDKNPSLGITLKDNGKWLINCLSCGANGQAVCDVLGIDVTALFPPNDNPRYEKQPRIGFSAWQLLHAIQPDLVRLLVIANMLREIEALTEEDRAFIASLVIRLSDGINYLEGSR